MLEFYRLDPSLKTKSYQEQQRALFQHGYTYSDNFSRTMRKLGHEAEEIVYDLEILQKSWAAERRVFYRAEHWREDILLAQIEALRPEIIYFQDIHSLSHSIRKDLKKRFPFIKLIVIFRGFPGITATLLEELSVADLLLVGSPILQRRCKVAGLNPHLVYHFFDHEILEKLPSRNSETAKITHDFTFVGSSGYGYGINHMPRYWTLVELLKRTPLEAWVDEAHSKESDSLLSKAKSVGRQFIGNVLLPFDETILQRYKSLPFVPSKLKRVVEEVLECRKIHKEIGYKSPPQKPLVALFPHRCHNPLFGMDMYHLLACSKITFNKHSTPAVGAVDNIRMFQATGVGACLLTDTGDNMGDLFEEDREVVTYSSLEECIEKATYLLENEKTRKEISENGKKRTLKDHNVMNRCQQINALLQTHF